MERGTQERERETERERASVDNGPRIIEVWTVEQMMTLLCKDKESRRERQDRRSGISQVRVQEISIMNWEKERKGRGGLIDGTRERKRGWMLRRT